MTEGAASPYPEATSATDQWQRVVLNREVDRKLDSLGPESMSAAEVSGDSHAGKAWRRYESLDHPPFDVLAPVTRPGEFDVVICEQVLEHVEDPFLAARNLHDLCAPGGHVIVSTPFMIKVHELPFFGMKDYWRFTPRGLRVLLERAGLEVDEVGQWGNRDCIVHNLDRWSAYEESQSLADEPDMPVQVWAFARRPSSADD